MGAYLYFKTESNPDEVVDYLFEENQLNKKLEDLEEQTITLVDKQHLSWCKENRPDLLEWETAKLGTGDIKTSGGLHGKKFEEAGYTEEDLLEMWTQIFEELNKRFEMKYYANSCAFSEEEYYFSLEQMKRITQNGKLLSGKTSSSERTRKLYDKYYAMLSEPKKEIFDISIIKEKDQLQIDGVWREIEYVTYKDEFRLKYMHDSKFRNNSIKEIAEHIEGYRKYVPKIRYMGANADIESYVLNKGDLIYLELAGQENMVKSITAVLMQGRTKLNEHNVDASFGYFNINKAGNKRKMIGLDNGIVHAILYHSPSIKDTNFHVLIGKTEEELQNSFSVWMEKSQPLPYPKGFEDKIYSHLVELEIIEPLQALNMYASSVDPSIAEEEYLVLQNVILKVCKENGLISPDAKPLKLEAPLPKSPYLKEDQVKKIFDTLKKMPKTYELEDMEIKPVGLKLFSPDMTLYITEADKGSENDEFENMQTQCFGYVKNESDPDLSEWGYINVPHYLELQYPNGGGFEQDLYFEDMYINSKGKVGTLEELTIFRTELKCPNCSSKAIEIHESIDGENHCSCIDCGNMFSKKIQ